MGDIPVIYLLLLMDEQCEITNLECLDDICCLLASNENVFITKKAQERVSETQRIMPEATAIKIPKYHLIPVIAAIPS